MASYLSVKTVIYASDYGILKYGLNSSSTHKNWLCLDIQLYEFYLGTRWLEVARDDIQPWIGTQLPDYMQLNHVGKNWKHV